MNFADLNAKARASKIRETVDGLLKTAEGPMTTSALVAAVAAFLGLSKADQNIAARDIVHLAKSHEMARQTGEVFVKYGKEMRRWEWLPSHVKPPVRHTPRLTAAEIERRRAEVARLEDEWTIPAAADFLEDEQ
jgi:hypothetical protein